MRRVLAKIRVCAYTAFGLFFLSCMGKGGGDSINTSTGTAEQIGTYRVSGNNLILTTGQNIYTSRYCMGDSLKVQSDTSEGGIDTMPFKITGNTLQIAEGSDSGFTDPSAIVMYYMNFTRTGGGSGIEGSWTFSSGSYQILAGTLTTAESDSIAADMADMGLEMGSFRLEIRNGTFSVYFTECNADWFIDEWNWSSAYSDSAMYNISVTKLNCNSVKLIGMVSGEQVTLTWASNGNITYTSTNTQHAAYTYIEEPTTCPDPYEPEWFSDFRTANLKSGLPKVMAIHKSNAPSPLFRILIKKLRSLSESTSE